MTRRPRLPVALSLLFLSTSGVVAQEGEPVLAVRVDSARHEVVLTTGPFDLPSMPGHQHDGMMTKFSTRFDWPVEAMGRGFTFELRDAEGRKVSQRVLHHLMLINNSRRQLLLPMRERIMAVGRETKNLMLPNTIGMPIEAGSRMRLDIMWHNETPADADGVMLTLRIRYSPANLVPVPTTVLPLSMDLADGPGRSNSFLVPPGRFTASREFIMPVTGRLIAVSGHMHDWGVALRLEEAATGKVLTTITPVLDSAGRITHMPIRLFGIAGDGLKLRANRRYRLVAVYDNRTDAPMEGMAHMDGIFSPSDLSKWPDQSSKMTAYQDDGAYVPPTVEAPMASPDSATDQSPQHQHPPR